MDLHGLLGMMIKNMSDDELNIVTKLIYHEQDNRFAKNINTYPLISEHEKQLVMNNLKIDAIKEYRNRNRVDLLIAKKVVEHYCSAIGR